MIKKICVMTSAHNPFDVRIYHKEIKTLLTSGYDVSLIAQCDKRCCFEDIRFFPIAPASHRFARFFSVMPKIIVAAFRQKADAYHFHDPDLIIAGLLLKIFTSSKVIYDVHEDVPKQILSKAWIPSFARKLISFIFGLPEKNIAKTFDAVIVATPSIAKGFGGDKTVCVANYPKLEYFNDIIDQKKERLSPEFRVIYAGGLDGIRGIKEIVKAYDLIKDVNNIKMVLVGPFSDETFKKELSESDGWNKVDYLGVLPLRDAYKQMAAADAGLVCFLPEPNHTEALPNKIFEYMAAGIPVIASDFPLWKEIIEGNDCGICINPNDPEAIAHAIESLAKQSGRAKKMGKNGRMAVKNKYNWAVEEKKLLFLYANL
ncbi:MAG TPA: glycosyltransferase family 4 protein [Candidatus Paceibacterota bacterium]|nr:glycosyltransferase family 4 protein [Candidatus Pacearchaeota archaeon]HRZ50673.1 glycosyltransferase family 4 protein [Candidatus Paceibacterota bacterium]HSA36430.1 glycosyltransferase family 4 protein [Candidatus Paceibacterota bacterium]